MADMNAAALSVALDERDRPTCHHCDRVAGLSIELGRRSALSEHDLRLLWMAAGAHDLGKIGIPDAVLKKMSPFTEDDWAIMRAHSAKGQRIILAADLPDGETIGRAVRHHHERYDGNGYPDGLAGEAIPILSRIIAVVDTYDAMARMRPYSPSTTHREIMAELRRVEGRQHDAYLVGKFAAFIEHSPFKA